MYYGKVISGNKNNNENDDGADLFTYSFRSFKMFSCVLNALSSFKLQC